MTIHAPVKIEVQNLKKRIERCILEIRDLPAELQGISKRELKVMSYSQDQSLELFRNLKKRIERLQQLGAKEAGDMLRISKRELKVKPNLLADRNVILDESQKEN